jgi:proline dehydrogenase
LAAGGSKIPRRLNPLIRAIPGPLVRFFARPYVAGDSLAKAMDAAAEAWRERGLRTTLDLLSEDIDSEETVRRNIDTYLEMVDAAAGDPRFPSLDARPTLSLKLSSYTTDPLDCGGRAESSREALFRIAEHAAEREVRLTIDMESRHWTDFTLDALRDLHRAGHRHVGAVLQSRLHRTAQDLDRLPPGCRVRLVIGIYQEPASVALTDKAQMKERLLEYARTLLGRGHYVELGTHDERVVQRFVDDVVPAGGVGPERFELQMLYGVPRAALLRQVVERGFAARLYVPFALSWPLAVGYLRRRLDEYPAMMFLVAKNLLPALTRH